VVGDSLTVGTDYFGKLSNKLSALNVWTNVVVDAKVGRKTGAGGDELKKLLKTYPNTTAVVIALGTNDMIVHSERSYPNTSLQNILSVSGNLPILWVNPTFSPTIHSDWLVRAKRMNALLATTASSKTNFYVADWAKYFVPKGPSRFISDGVHLTVSGYKTRTTFMVDQISRFGQTIVLATTTTTSTTTSTSTTMPASSSSTSTSSSSSSTSTLASTTTVSPTTT
jgi:lysophospholipase L1-like esterase